ncbi:MAG: hypothetical protein ACXW3P_04660 [Rhodospirillales bacterium]
MHRIAAALLVASTTTTAAGDVDLPAQDRQALDVTIYANGLALIRDKPEGDGRRRHQPPGLSRRQPADDPG